MHNITGYTRWAFSMANLLATQRWLRATEHMVACAHERVLASAEAAHAKGLKYKGVVDLNGPATPRGKAAQTEACRVACGIQSL